MVGLRIEGRESEINLRDISQALKDKGAIAVKTNTNKLSTGGYIEEKIGSKEELENELIDEHVEQFDIEDLSKQEKKDLTKNMMHVLSQTRREDEKKEPYKERVVEEALETIGLKEELEEIL